MRQYTRKSVRSLIVYDDLSHFCLSVYLSLDVAEIWMELFGNFKIYLSNLNSKNKKFIDLNKNKIVVYDRGISSVIWIQRKMIV